MFSFSLPRRKSVLQTPLHRLSLPESSQNKLTFCDGDSLASVKAWLQELPAAKLDICGLNLYHALPELVQTHLPSRTRLEMLESMRKLAIGSSSTLAKTLTKHSLTLNDLELKSVVISQGILKSLAHGYIKCARELINEKNTSAEILALALHRALDALNILLLRTYLLYVPVPSHIWESIYAIYLTAVQIRIDNHKVVDTLTLYSSDSIKHLMIRTLSLACSAPSKLSTAEICALYTKLKLFESFIDIDPWNKSTEHVFAIDASGDDVPDFISNFSEQNLNGHGFTLGFHRLIPRFDELSLKPIKPHNLLSLPNPSMSTELKNQLKEYWQGLLIRKHNRTAVNQEFEIISDLQALLLSSPTLDSNSGANANNVSPLMPSPLQDEETIKISCWNESTNGYCLHWQGNLKQEIRHKQLMGLKKSPSMPWQVVSICWIRKFKQDLLIGVQALSSFTETAVLSMVSAQSVPSLQRSITKETFALLLYSHPDQPPHSILIPRKWIVDNKLNQTPAELIMKGSPTAQLPSFSDQTEKYIHLTQMIFQNDHYLQFYFSSSDIAMKQAGSQL